MRNVFPSPLAPSPRGEREEALLFVEQGQNFFNAGGVGQTLNNRFVIQRVGQAGNHLDMLVIASGDTNHQTGDVVLFFTEAHAIGY